MHTDHSIRPKPTDIAAAAQQVERDGFVVVEDVLEPPLVGSLIAAVEREAARAAADGDKPGYAFRDLFNAVPETRALLAHPRVAALVRAVLGDAAFAVRGLLFDKVDGANWRVAWHQDQAIAINDRHAGDAVPGFGPSSIKNGVPHTRAPAGVLQHMLAVRLHLDDCGDGNGPLRCAPGSHTLGRLDAADALDTVKRRGEQTYTVRAGGAILMRPLVLHASNPAATPRHRRVLHLEFASRELPAPLAWHERLPLGSN